MRKEKIIVMMLMTTIIAVTLITSIQARPIETKLRYFVQDVNQDVFNRGFPVRNNWGAAQSFKVNVSELSHAQIYLRKFGNPDFDLRVELKENGINGTLLDVDIFSPGSINSSWNWLSVDFNNISVNSNSTYFIVLSPGTGNNSYGYEWGYAFGNVYDDGSFWFTRDGGDLWRDLPTRYDFTFRTFGYI